MVLLLAIGGALIVTACGAGRPDDADGASTAVAEQAGGQAEDLEIQSDTPVDAPAEIRDPQGVLLLGIGMHIEPLGESISPAISGKPRSLEPSPPVGGRGRWGEQTYASPQLFERFAESINSVAEVIESHNGRMTVQTNGIFAAAALKFGNPLLQDLADRGHEIGLHFHEDVLMGDDSESLPVATWCDAIREQIETIRAAVDTPVDYSSGGNLYQGRIAASECAGLSVTGEWKNPETQETPPELLGTAPWRPSGGAAGDDVSALMTHDPDGTVIFLPEGIFTDPNSAVRLRQELDGGVAYFEFLADALRDSLEEARSTPGVHVFHFTIHPLEFQSDGQRPFTVVDEFLRKIVDPLVAKGAVRWATYAEMAEAYRAWEAKHPGIGPRRAAGQENGIDVSASGGATTADTSSENEPSTRMTRGRRSLARPSGPGVLTDLPFCAPLGTPLLLDLHFPNAETRPQALVLYIHGGGWSSGDKSTGIGLRYLDALLDAGFIVGSANYRLAPQHPHPAAVNDVQCAVRFLRTWAEALGIDPDRIGIMGSSAGGHLATLAAVLTEPLETPHEWTGVSSRVQALVDFFGPVDLTKDFPGANQAIITRVFGAEDRSDPVVFQASPVMHVSADDPPTLIIHGDRDPLVPVSQSVALFESLKNFGVEATLLIVKGAGHSWASNGDAKLDPPDEVIRAEIVAFLVEALR